MNFSNLFNGVAGHDEAFALINRGYSADKRSAGQFFETTEEMFNYFLNVLPPADWTLAAGYEAFSMSEYSTETLTDAFLRQNGRFFCICISRRMADDFTAFVPGWLAAHVRGATDMKRETRTFPALDWSPNGLPRGDKLADFTGFCLSPTRQAEHDQMEVCMPAEAEQWSIYGFHADAEEWQIVHDADLKSVGETLARIHDATGARIEYRDTGRAYADTTLAGLYLMVSQRVQDEPWPSLTWERLQSLRMQIEAAISVREVVAWAG